MLPRIFFLLFLIAFSLLQLTQAGVYRWKDKNGKIHFSDKPHTDATQVNIKAPKPSGLGISKKQLERRKILLNDFQEKRDKRQQQVLEDKEQQAAIDNYCQGLKNRLLNYEEANYLVTRNNAGERQELSSQRKKKEEQKLRTLINERCSN